MRGSLHGEGPAADRWMGRARPAPEEAGRARVAYARAVSRRAWYADQIRRHSVVDTEAAPACWSR
jgi:hypothetical protein